MFGFTPRNNFEKAIETIWNEHVEPNWKQEFEFKFANPFNDTDLTGNTLTIALPGFSKEDIKIDIDGDLLVVSSEVDSEKETKFKKSFKRSFKLVKDVDVDSISATMENGILIITFVRKNVTKEVKIS